MNFKYLFFLLILTTTFACKSEAEKIAEQSASRNALIDSTINQSQKKLLAQQIDSVFSKYQFNGSVAVLKNDEILYQKENGFEDFKQKKKLDSNSVFAIASLSKQFTAVLILLQEDLGKLNTEDKVSDTHTQQPKTEERQGICFVCNKKDNMSNLHEVHGRGVVHKSCYDSIPLCSICKEKLIYDSDGNGICDYKCDELCTNCWTNKANVKGGLCDKCEWNKAFENKATCSGCDGNGNIVDASLAGTKCPYCGEEIGRASCRERV